MQTVFYFAGGALVLIALAVSFVGMRREDFPSDATLRIGVVLVALVIGVTAYTAVQSSKDEQQKREAEQNEASSSAQEAIAKSDTGASGTPDTGGQQAPGSRDQVDTQSAAGGGATTVAAQGDPKAGAQVFTEQGCGSCHSLQAAGATAEIGPNLDAELVTKDTAFIETSIVDPDATIEQGFSADIMPEDFGTTLSDDDLANLVAYLAESTGAGGGSASSGKSAASK